MSIVNLAFSLILKDDDGCLKLLEAARAICGLGVSPEQREEIAGGAQ